MISHLPLPLILALASALFPVAYAKKNLLRNPSFEQSEIYVDPWTSDGTPGSYGINNPGKNTEAQDGRNFAYVVGDWEIGQQVLGVKKGETYMIQYYAYSWAYAPADPNQLCGWEVDFGAESQSANLTQVFNSTNLPPQSWPFFVHTFVASADNPALVFRQQNNTVFFIDHASVTCRSCSTPDHTGAIVGGTIGGIAGVALLVFAGFFVWVRRFRKPRGGASSSSGRTMEEARLANGNGPPSTTTGYPSYTTTPVSFAHPGSASPNRSAFTPVTASAPSREGGAASPASTHRSNGSQGNVQVFGGLPEVMESMSPTNGAPPQNIDMQGRRGSVGEHGYASYGSEEGRTA